MGEKCRVAADEMDPVRRRTLRRKRLSKSVQYTGALPF